MSYYIDVYCIVKSAMLIVWLTPAQRMSGNDFPSLALVFWGHFLGVSVHLALERVQGCVGKGGMHSYSAATD